ncbi:MAG: hypothetical protein AAF702_02310 [Chloroflexota bacterium]
MRKFTDFFLAGRALTLALAELGYTLVYCSEIIQPASVQASSTVTETVKKNMQLFDLGNEQARREAIVAPILSESAAVSQGRIYTEQPVITDELGGSVDYWVVGRTTVLIIEAKNDDIERGLGQLCAELIAASSQPDASDPLYGVITSGREWRFATIDTTNKQIVADQQVYAVPAQIEVVVRLLVAILGGKA